MTHRLTIDCEEDYRLISAVYDALHKEGAPPFGLQAILDFLDSRPDVFSLNQKYAGVNWYRHHLKDLRMVDVSRTRWTEQERADRGGPAQRRAPQAGDSSMRSTRSG